MRATLRIRMALVPFRMNTYFFDDLCSKLTDDLPRLLNIIETSVCREKKNSNFIIKHRNPC